MRIRLAIAIILMGFVLQGCWFIFIPIGPIIEAIRGPRYCVPPDSAYVGTQITLMDGRSGKVTAVHGISSLCPTEKYPICVELELEGRDK